MLGLSKKKTINIEGIKNYVANSLNFNGKKTGEIIDGIKIVLGEELYEELFPDTIPFDITVARLKGEEWAMAHRALILTRNPEKEDIERAKKENRKYIIVLNLSGKYGMY